MRAPARRPQTTQQKVAAPKTTRNSLKDVTNEDLAKKSQDEPADDTTTTSYDIPTIVTPRLGVPNPHKQTLTAGTTTEKSSASLLFEPISDGQSHVADVGPSARHAASTTLEPEASHGLNLEDLVHQQASSETGTKRKRAWGAADEVDEANTEPEKVDTKPDSSLPRLYLSSESDTALTKYKPAQSSEAFGDGDGSGKDRNVPSETALGEDWSRIAKMKVVCSDVDDEPDDMFEVCTRQLKGAQAHGDNPCKVSCDRCDHPPRFAPLTRGMTHCSLASTIAGLPILQSSTEEPDAKSLEDQLGQIRRDLQALRAMLEPVIMFINTPNIDHLKSRLPPVVKIFVATPFFYKQLASAESFALVLTKSGLVPTEAYNKNLPFRHNLLSNIPALLVQGRSDLLRHIHKAQKDKATLGRTINQ
ncbi:BQ5605_C001g00435 [Microbotryum silenes-dioicae]|uniref:BQ5605_C001g00435 protein n=1 Tax=Microbotryum silenes-dioicae TaxID=796604 RepID=A0A2X0P5U4_9BASI|nr:BQ5605_C001g00435 [Microbotryum silenes-dioicae]